MNILAKTPSLSIREDKKKVEKDIDNKDISAELTKNIVVSWEQFFLPSGYFVLGKQWAYNKEWDEITYLYFKYDLI